MTGPSAMTCLESTGEFLPMAYPNGCPTKTSRRLIHCPYCGGCRGQDQRCLYCGGEFLASWLSLDQPAISLGIDSMETV